MNPLPAVFEFGVGAPIIGFDVGGTDTKSVVVPRDGLVRRIERTPTARSSDRPAEALLDEVELLLPRLIDQLGEEPSAIGLSVPGLVDEERGLALFSANLAWRDVPFRQLCESRFGYPVAFGHDVRAAGDAELRFGAARGFHNVVTLAIGTGIAGAIVIDAHPYASHGYAGELGHALADPQGALCPCGARGCLETIASAGSIARRYSARSGTSVSGARDVLARMHAGDDIAREVWNDAITALADHIARLAAILAPEAVVIGGGLAEADADLFDPLRAEVDARLSFHRRPQLIKAALGEQAGALGTALAARDLVAQKEDR